jgi:hypothetical protein
MQSRGSRGGRQNGFELRTKAGLKSGFSGEGLIFFDDSTSNLCIFESNKLTAP